MGQALYRKYRPRSFAEAVGQEAITKTLDEALKSDRISHAYLFAGPRGVGKTSIARILAHRVNDLPYEQDNSHMDIIEIDAASNRRIDEIRDLREKVHITPTSAKYKVYIIDEVHMLTKEAFNALLKTLEEPPAHCIFILATTESHKLPETIISRTQQFNFKPISRTAAQTQLQKIAKQEKIKTDIGALELLAEYGEGSLRDIIGLLDQLSTSKKPISEHDIRDLLGIPSVKAVDEMLSSIADGNARESLNALDGFKEQAVNPAKLAKVISQRLRHDLLENHQANIWQTALLKELVHVSSSTNPQETLELAVLEVASANRRDEPDDKPSPLLTDKNPVIVKPKKMVAKPRADSPKKQASSFSLEQWSELLERVKAKAPSLYTALRLAQPSIRGDVLNMAFPFPLHQKKVAEARHIELIAKTIEDISGSGIVIKCSVDKDLANKREPLVPVEDRPVLDIQSISNIFGSAEMLES
ncbi:DNA polymerase III subunit gamma/tau [Candidatus Saccharibacteria bacterium]|nr:DNA polymerase III subunit gamma/tau [Candidatus Saccharibacteria bacterium]